MRINIDIERSISSERLRPIKLDFNGYLNVGLYLFLSSTFLFIGLLAPTLWMKNMIQMGDTRGLWIVMLLFIPGLLTAYGLIKDNRLKRFKGRDKETNKKIMISIIKDKYKTNMIYDGEDMLTYYKRASLINFGTRVIVCFDNEDILINLSKFNVYGLKSFFHQPFLDWTTQKIIKDFNKRVG